MIPREILNKVRRIEITTRSMVRDTFAGSYESIFKGRGMEFDEVREYQPGDDIRNIDWNVTARTGWLHVKKFVEERELTVLIVFDASGSFDFGTGGRLKREVAAEVGAVLAFAAIRNNDKVGLLIFTDEIETFVPPRKGRKHVLRIIREILHFRPRSKGTNIASALEHAMRVVKRHSVMFCISGFRDSGYESALTIANRKHDVVAVTVTDPKEMEIPLGLIEVEDGETGKRVILELSRRKFANMFSEAAEAVRERRKSALTRAKVDEIGLKTDEDYVEPLVRFFEGEATEVEVALLRGASTGGSRLRGIAGRRMSRGALLVLAALTALIVLPIAARAAEVAPDTEAPFDVYAGLDRKSVAVGDTFRLDLDLSWQDGVEVKPLAMGDKLGPFTVRDLHYGIASPEEGGFSRRVSVLLTVFETGEQTVPAMPVVYIDQAGTPQTAKTVPLSIDVVSVLPEDAAEPKDIKSPISVPKRWKDLILSYALLIGLVAGAATSVMLSVMRREQLEAFFVKLYTRIAGPVRRLILMLLAAIGLIHRERDEVFDVEVTEPDLDPEVAALLELDRIDALALLQREMVKQHYTLVSESVRRYLERKYDVLAMESPTSFTLEALAGIRISPDGLNLTGEVLEEGDMVKFAKFIPGPEPAGSLTARARSIVGLTGTFPEESQRGER